MSAVHQILNRKYQAISEEPGLREVFVKSSIDRTMQPAALYIPATLKQSRALVILLHGNPQSEAEILAHRSSGASRIAQEQYLSRPTVARIMILRNLAEPIVYDALRAARAALPIDPRRIYLVGYSMGGFSVYKIGTRRGAWWAGVMSISGAVLNSEMSDVLYAWRGTPLYVVTGAHDDEIPTIYGEETARTLYEDGLPVSFYEEPTGGHTIRTLMPSLTAAWDDMHVGVVRGVRHDDAQRKVGLPASAPTKTFKP